MSKSVTARISFLSTIFFSMAMCAIAQPTFINKIPIPPMYDMADYDTIHLEMRKSLTHKFNPGNPADTILNGTSSQNGIETWNYNLATDSIMNYLGPVLKWHSSSMTNITVTNKLPQPSTTHWHGAELPASMDGGPHQPIAVGETWPVSFKTLDSACTMWFHPHYHDNTYPHVSLGLSGMIYVEQDIDPINDMLPRTYGVDDLPLIIQDLGLGYDSASNSYSVDTGKARHPYNLVNGYTNPYFEVPAHMIRLRILNGSSRKGIQIAVSDSYSDKDMSGMDEFLLVATDGGYAIKPEYLKTIMTGPGERIEILLDLTGYAPGDTVYLRNMKHLMPGYIVGSPNVTAGPGKGKDSTGGEAFLQLRIVADPSGYTPVDKVDNWEIPWEDIVSDTVGAYFRPTKRLIQMPNGGFTIDSTTYDMMRIDDIVCEGAKEVWTIHNESPIAHPFHIHKIFFRIIDIDSAGTSIDLRARGLIGPKDDVMVLPGWKLRFLTTFNDYPTDIEPMNCYMYHCHILTHEDSEGGGMMHQFVVTDKGPCVTSVEEDQTDATMLLYPNPSGSIVNLKGQNAVPSHVNIIDMQGQLLMKIELPAFNGSTPLNLSRMPQGIFIVEWHAEGKVNTRKIVLQ